MITDFLSECCGAYPRQLFDDLNTLETGVCPNCGESTVYVTEEEYEYIIKSATEQQGSSLASLRSTKE